jgi:hypothetical protein
MKNRYLLFLVVIASSLLASLLGGCGGGSSNSTASRTGRATFTVLWPTRAEAVKSKVIPASTQSIVISLVSGTTPIASKTLTRSGGGGTATADFLALNVGTLHATIVAYPNPDGTGLELARAETDVTIVENTTQPITITLQSTITTIVTNPPGGKLIIGQPVIVSATPKDANGNIVPVPGENTVWTTDAPAVVDLTLPVLLSDIVLPPTRGNMSSTHRDAGPIASGAIQLHGNQQGTAHITVREIDSGITNTFTVTVGTLQSTITTIFLEPTPPILVQGQAVSLTARGTDVNGNDIPIPAANLQWSSDSTSIAVVDDPSRQSITIFGGSQAGSTTIRVKEVDSNVTASIPVTVRVNVTVSPNPATITLGETKQFGALVTGATNTSVTWSVVETGGGSVTAGGLYTAPSTPGTYHVKATSVADPTQSGTAAVTVTSGSGIIIVK